MTSAVSSRWLDGLLGRDASMRKHVLLMLATGQFYALCVGVMCHASYLGLMSWHVAYAIGGVMVANYLVFLALIRSGWTERFSDPMLALPQGMLNQLMVASAYVLITPVRADVIILMCQTLVVSVFRLKPDETLRLGAWSVGALALAQFWLWTSGTPDFSGTLALAHFVVSATALGILTLVLKLVSDIRVRMHQQAESLRQALDQASVLATTDMLTGLMSRRSMMGQLTAATERARETGKPLSVALVDIDHFKQINDQFGHQCGDDVLKGFAAMATADLRDTDRLCRWGGEEFLLLLVDVDVHQACVAVDRLRMRVKSLSAQADTCQPITISVGVAQWREGESMTACLERADAAMYRAKSLGRDRCESDASAHAAGAASQPHAQPTAGVQP